MLNHSGLWPLHGCSRPCGVTLAHVVKSNDLNCRGLGYGMRASCEHLQALPQTVVRFYNVPTAMELGLDFLFLLHQGKRKLLVLGHKKISSLEKSGFATGPA